MNGYIAVGRKWGLVSRFDNLFLDFKGKKHYLLELREKEWNVNVDLTNIDGMRVFYEMGNKSMVLKKLKQIGVKDPEIRVEIILEIKRIVERRFGTK